MACAAAVAIGGGVLFAAHRELVPEAATVTECFVPGEDCGARIVAAIDAARRQIRVQAYGFSAPAILGALARAQRRGLDVAVIVDKSDRRRICRDSGDLGVGVPVWIDHAPGIAHNKVIVVDQHLVIGGSYNYTASAQRRNVENVTFIDSATVAAQFLANWRRRRDAPTTQPCAR